MNSKTIKVIYWFLVVFTVILGIRKIHDHYFIDVEYRFINAKSEINTIEIVRVRDFSEEKKDFEYEDIVTVSYKDLFLDDFDKVYCDKFFAPPTYISSGDTVIKISYNNGDYELIADFGREEYINGVFSGYGYYSFNEEEFEALISKYTNESD